MITPELWSYLYTIGAAQGALLAVALWRHAGQGHSYRILAVWIGVISVHLGVLILHLRTPPDGPWLLRAYGLTQFLPFIYAAFFFVYVRALIGHRRFQWGDLIHAAPMMLVVAINAPLLTLPTAALRAVFTAGQLPANMAPWQFALIGPALMVCSTGYLIAASALILDYRKRLAQQRSDADRQGLRWLLVMAAWQFVIWIVALLQATLSLPGINHWTIYGTVSAWVFVLGYMSLRRPQPLVLEPPASAQTPVSDQYQDVLLRVDALMQREQLFRQSALTIAALAKRSGFPRYLVSEAINRERGSNFYEYVNRWRVEAAKHAIAQDNQTQTLLDIAYDVGFTAKSTFNQAFKRFA